MNASKVFGIEFFIASGINSWGALKGGYAPWPPTIIASAIAMAILSMTSAIDEKLSVLLGTGFLLASIISVAQSQSGNTNSSGKWASTFGAVPPAGTYDVLKIGGSTVAASTPSTGQSNGQSQ